MLSQRTLAILFFMSQLLRGISPIWATDVSTPNIDAPPILNDCSGLGTASIWDPRLGSFTSVPSWTFDDFVCGVNTIYTPQPPPWRVHRTQLQTNGVSRATLTPQGIDLSFLPKIELSETLTLMPHLFYGPIFWPQKRLAPFDAPPKFWQNHHGELIRYVHQAGLQYDKPLGELSGNGTDREPHYFALETIYINGSGQSVTFYPAPSSDHTWFSQEGNNRLRDTMAAGPTSQFVLEMGNGQKLFFEKYRTSRVEGLALHYRVHRVEDRYGNWLDLQFKDSQSNAPTIVQAYQTVNGVDAALHRMVYGYENGNGRLKYVRMPAYAGQTSLNPAATWQMDFYYVDELPSLYAAYGNEFVADQLLQAGANPLVHAGNGATVALTQVMEVDLYFQPNLFSAGGLAFVDQSNNFQTGLTQPLPWPQLEMDLVFNNLAQVNEPAETKRGYLLQIGAGAAARTFQLAGSKWRYRLNSSDYPQTTGFDASQYPDRLSFAKLGGAAGLPSEGLYRAKIFPMVKTGDAMMRADGQLAEVAWAATMTAAAVPLTSALTGTVYHLREDQRYRIAAMVITDPQAGPDQKSHRLIRYADGSVNHAEIAATVRYHTGVLDEGVPKVISETEYLLQRIATLKGSADFAGAMIAPETYSHLWRYCDMSQNWAIGQTVAPIPIRIGLTHQWEREIDIIRRKTLRYLDGAGQYREEITRYGGAFRAAFAGDKTSFADLSSAGVGPDEQDARDCHFVQWGLDAKPFDFTWEIRPDGSATIFDLSPAGLGLDPLVAGEQQRRRSFKTYTFDTRFKQAIANHATLNIMLDETLPFFEFLPPYEASNGSMLPSEIQANPGQPTLPIPTLQALFELKNASGNQQTFAYKAKVVGFTAVPSATYSQEADVANPNQRFIHETVALIHGQGFSNGVGIQDAAFRTSILAILKEYASLNLEEALFKGHLKSNLTFSDPQWPSPKTQVVAWSKGGRIDKGSFFQTYFDRLRLLRLKPSFQYQLVNQNGLSWNTALNCLALDSNDVIQAQRWGHGGYLGAAKLTSAVVGATQISVIAAAPAMAPLLPGDIFYNQAIIHSLVAVTGSQITFQPALTEAISANGVHEFFRRPNQISADRAGRYRGYDGYANMAYRETYLGSQGLYWPTSPSPAQALLPYFFDTNQPAQPWSITWNDSTQPANNDPQNWRFFGRIQHMWRSQQKPFWDYSAADEDGVSLPVLGGNLASGFVAQWQYDDVHQPWNPIQSTNFYRPFTLSDWFEFETQLSSFLTSANHPEDAITATTYYHNQNATAFVSDTHGMRFGLDRTITNRKRGFAGAFSKTLSGYDALGHLVDVRTVHVAPGYETLATQNQFQVDGNTELVFQTATYRGAVDNSTDLNLINPVLQNRERAQYDAHGRATRQSAYDASGFTGDANLLGFVTKTEYNSPLLTSQYALPTATSPTSQHLGKVENHQDGLGRPTRTVTQTGPAADIFEQIQTYDDFGRPLKSYANAGVGQPMATRGYMETVYNLRGEASGNLQYLKAGNSPVASTWVQRNWDGASQKWQVYHVSQSQPSNPASQGIDRIGIKRLLVDVDNTLAEASDFELNLALLSPSAPSQWYSLFAADDALLIADIVARLDEATQSNRAEYQKDRMGNIINATVHPLSNTSTSTQTRTFQYDQKGRLRQESHPEYAGQSTQIRYRDMNAFDQATQMETFVASNQWRNTFLNYDPNGLLLSRRTYADNLNTSGPAAEEVSWTYRYQDTSLASLRFRFAEQVSEETTAFDSQQITYRYQIDSLTGALLRKTMVPNLDGFTNQVSLTYTYDEWERLSQITYPAAISGAVSPLQLGFEYADGSDQYGHLRRIRDLSQPSQPLLIEGVRTGAGGLDQFHFGLGGGSLRGVDLAFDSLNRLQTLGHRFVNSAGLARLQKRERNYNSQGQVRKLTLKEGSQASGGSLPSLREFGFGYDSVGQLTTYQWQEIGSPMRTIDFDYDPFGNLTQRQDSQTGTVTWDHNDRNQIQANNYSHYGELIAGPSNGSTFQLDYSPHGRLVQHTLDGQTHRMTYDPAGLRVLVRAPGDAGKLTFYDPAGMALVQWQKENGIWRWHKSFVPLQGQTVLTFEHDGATSIPPPVNRPTMSSPALLLQPQAQWQSVPEVTYYDFQIAPMDGPPLETIFAVAANQVRFGPPPPGPYRIRARSQHGAWGPWQAVVVAQPGFAEILGQYPLEWDVADLSVFQNHGSKDGPLPTSGWSQNGLAFSDDDSLTIPDPFALSQTNAFSLVLRIKTQPGNKFTQPVERTIFTIDSLRLHHQADASLAVFSKAAMGTTLADYNFTTSQWHQLVLTGDANEYALFLDGQKIISGNLLEGLPSGDIRFGKNASFKSFLGSLDDIQIWNRLLSDQEVVDLFQGGTP